MEDPQPIRTPITLVGHLSHELRTPLNAIMGYTEMVREELEELGQYGLARDMDRIHRAGGELATLFDKVLDLAELESGEARLGNNLLDLVEVVDEVTESLKPLALRNNSSLAFVDAPHTLPMVGDAHRIRRVVQEIIENACRYTRDGSIEVRVARHIDDPVDFMRIEVVDTGIGIAESEQMKLFDAFYRSDEARSAQGLGLGLSISQSLCRLMGGGITVHSQYGSGSTFTIRIPAEPAEG